MEQLKKYLEEKNCAFNLNFIHNSWYNADLLELFREVINNLEHYRKYNIEYNPSSLEEIFRFLNTNIKNLNIVIVNEYPIDTTKYEEVLKEFKDSIIFIPHNIVYTHKNNKVFDNEYQCENIRKIIYKYIKEKVKLIIFIGKYFDSIRKKRYPVSCKYSTSKIDENYPMFIKSVLAMYNVTN